MTNDPIDEIPISELIKFAKMDKWMVPGPSIIPPKSGYEQFIESKKANRKNKRPAAFAVDASAAGSSTLHRDRRIKTAETPPVIRRSSSKAAAALDTRAPVMIDNGTTLKVPIGTTVSVKQLAGPLVPKQSEIETDDEADEHEQMTSILRIVDESTAVAAAMSVSAASMAATQAAAVKRKPANEAGAFSLSDFYTEVVGSIDADEKKMKHITAAGVQQIPWPTKMKFELKAIVAYMPLIVEIMFESAVIKTLEQLDRSPFNEYGFWFNWVGDVKSHLSDVKIRTRSATLSHRSNQKDNNTAFGATDPALTYQPHVVLMNPERYKKAVMAERIALRFSATKRQFGCVLFLFTEMGFRKTATDTTIESSDGLVYHPDGVDTYALTMEWAFSVSSSSVPVPVAAAAAAAAPSKITSSLPPFDDFPDDFPASR